MTLSVHTARITYGGNDRLDVTRKSGDRDGIAFAPSWSILKPALAARQRGEIVSYWPAYREAYLREMRAGYRLLPDDWSGLLARPEVTLVCYCVDAKHCHRTLLAEILGKLGATVCGERV